MNEKNIVSIGAVIDRIKINGYIDCNEHDGYYDEYEYDNILYYLEKYKNLQSKIDKAIEFINSQKKTISKSQADLFNENRGNKSKLKVGTFMWNIDELLDILKEE